MKRNILFFGLLTYSIFINALQSKEIQSIITSKKHHPNSIKGDFDGDSLRDTATIVQNTTNKLYGLKIVFGNKKIQYIGIKKKSKNQNFPDLKLMGNFKVAPKNDIYYNDLDDDESTVINEKIKMPHDGIYLRVNETCEDGVLYLEKGQFKWLRFE